MKNMEKDETGIKQAIFDGLKKCMYYIFIIAVSIDIFVLGEESKLYKFAYSILGCLSDLTMGEFIGFMLTFPVFVLTLFVWLYLVYSDLCRIVENALFWICEKRKSKA